MSGHDVFLILGSIVATIVVLQLLGATAPDLRSVINIDFSAAGDPLVDVLTKEEYAYFEAHAPSFCQRVNIHVFSSHIVFDVLRSIDERAAGKKSFEWVMPPNYPMTLWEANLDEDRSASALTALTGGSQPKLVLQFVPNQAAILLGLIDGRFGRGIIGSVQEKNVLLTVPLSMAKLKKLRAGPVPKDAPWERWNFDVGIDDPKPNTFYWGARCKDIFGHARSLF